MEKISVVIPAHNEGRYIGKCLSSIRVAELKVDVPVEIVVCLNRCTDNTEAVAKAHGAVTVVENARNIAKIRNAGVKASTGNIVITIDADSWMSPGMLYDVVTRLRGGKYIGGGILIRPERLSLGIGVVTVLYTMYQLLTGISGGGAYWFYRKDFNAIGGFDEGLISAETLKFSRELKTLAKARGIRHGYIKNERMYTSVRKFDQLGDWYLFKDTRKMYRGCDEDTANKVWYDANR